VSKTIGIIAGRGEFPRLFAEAARQDGCRVVVVAHEGETSPELAQWADQFHWVKLGQLGKIIKIFKKEQVQESVLLGAITKTNVFRDVRPDLRGLALWGKIDRKHDDSILRAVAQELEREGIRVVESTRYLSHLLFPAGVLTKIKPSSDQLHDIAFGWEMAKAIGDLDIGQCVIVKERTVLAVEAIEGTDEAIRRGGALGKQGAVVVKVKKPEQDARFDLPAIGTATIETMAEAHAAVLAVEAGHALFFDRAAALDRANRAGIAVVGVAGIEQGRLIY